MEDWEKELREKLNEEIEDGWHTITSGKLTIGTGKGGKIDFIVAVHREIRKRASESNPTPIVEQLQALKPTEYKELTYEKLEQVMRDIIKNSNDLDNNI